MCYVLLIVLIWGLCRSRDEDDGKTANRHCFLEYPTITAVILSRRKGKSPSVQFLIISHLCVNSLLTYKGLSGVSVMSSLRGRTRYFTLFFCFLPQSQCLAMQVAGNTVSICRKCILYYSGCQKTTDVTSHGTR